MTDHLDNATIQPGWYTDPAGSPQLRWWDGSAWTQHLSDRPPATHAAQARSYAAQTQQAQSQQAQSQQAHAQYYAPAPRRQLAPGTPVYTPFIWAIAVLPILSPLALLFWNPVFRFETVGTQQVIDPASIFSVSYVLIVILSWLIYAADVVLAYFDWRALQQLGVERPFHWAWGFLSPVYLIGRSVIVHSVAPKRGLLPIWVSIGVIVVGFILGVVKLAEIFSLLASTLPPNV